jgi:hypothetical protein
MERCGLEQCHEFSPWCSFSLLWTGKLVSAPGRVKLSHILTRVGQNAAGAIK